MSKLRVLHYPQIPCEPFFVEVENEREAYLMSQTLADQHLFLYDNNFIQDYANMILVEMWDEEEEDWTEYYNDELGLDWEDYVDEHFNTKEDE